MAADLTTFAALGCHGTGVLTAVTAQDTTGVAVVHLVPIGVVATQLDMLVADLVPHATKTGMLVDADVVALVSQRARSGGLGRLVIDPVLVGSDGRALFGPEVAVAYAEQLLPHALVATPNAREATALTGRSITTVADARDAALALAERGPAWTVVTGGRADHGGDAVDVVVEAATGTVHELRLPWVATTAVRGTGCTFSAALTARLAAGAPVITAITDAKRFVHAALERGRGRSLGRGTGSVPHLFDH